MHRNNFDFLRLFAALLVLWSHQFVVTGLSQPIVFGLRSAGTLGVYIFFAVSGYLVSQSWIRSPHIGTFVENRIVRVWPAFAVVTVLVALVLGPVVTTEPLIAYLRSSATRDYLLQLTFDMRYKLPGVFQQNFYAGMASSSTWTIPFELQWYCVVLLLGVAGVLFHRWLATLLCSVFVAYVCLRQGTSGAQDGAFPQELGACFMVGILLAQFRSSLLPHVDRVFVASVIAAAFALFVGQGTVGLLVFVPMAAIAFGEGRYRWLTGVGRYGDISYGVYLWAWPVQQTVAWAFDNTQSFISGLAVAVPATLVLATLSWRWIEQPAMQWKMRQRSLRAARREATS